VLQIYWLDCSHSEISLEEPQLIPSQEIDAEACIHHPNSANLAHPDERIEQKVDYKTAGILKPSRIVQLIYFLKEKKNKQKNMTTATMQNSYNGLSSIFQICPELETLQEFNLLLFWPKPRPGGSMVGFRSIEFKGEINPLAASSERPNYSSALW